MKKITIILFYSIYLLNFLAGQQVSKVIELHNEQGLESARQIIPIDDEYILFNVRDAKIGEFLYRVTGLVRVDARGDTIWTYQFDLRDSLWFIPNGASCVVVNDTIYFAGMVTRKDYSRFLRFVAVSSTGKTLYWKDIEPPDDNLLDSGIYINQMIEGHDGTLVMTGNLKFLKYSGRSIWLLHLDHRFNVLQERFPFIPDRHIYYPHIVKSPTKGYMLGVSGSQPLDVLYFLARIDDRMNVLWHRDFKYTAIVQGGMAIAALHNHYVVAPRYEVPDSFPIPPFIFDRVFPVLSYVDSLGTVEWEHVFVDTFSPFNYSLKVVDDGKILGIGSRDYYGPYDTTDLEGGVKIPNSKLAHEWVFKADTFGNILWQKTIADTAFDRGIAIWDGVDTEEGYIFVGSAEKTNPTGKPFLNDFDIWWLTLDKDGCWNGNCWSNIVIVNDSTALYVDERRWRRLISEFLDTEEVETGAEEDVAQAKIYPNPTTDGIRIEWPQEADFRGEKRLHIYDAQGTEVMRLSLQASRRSFIHLNSFPPGPYLIIVTDASGKLLQTAKVMKQ